MRIDRERPLFRERLWASPWLFIASALVIPASLLVFLPINPQAGVVVAIAFYAACVAGLILGSPVIEVTTTEFRAGRAIETPVPTVARSPGSSTTASLATRSAPASPGCA